MVKYIKRQRQGMRRGTRRMRRDSRHMRRGTRRMRRGTRRMRRGTRRMRRGGDPTAKFIENEKLLWKIGQHADEKQWKKFLYIFKEFDNYLKKNNINLTNTEDIINAFIKYLNENKETPTLKIPLNKNQQKFYIELQRNMVGGTKWEIRGGTESEGDGGLPETPRPRPFAVALAAAHDTLLNFVLPIAILALTINLVIQQGTPSPETMTRLREMLGIPDPRLPPRRGLIGVDDFMRLANMPWPPP